MLKRVLPWSGVILLMLLVIGIGSYYSFAISPQIATSPQICADCSRPPPQIWEQPQQNQTFIKSSEGLFSIKWITISPKEFHFFYAFQSPHQGNLRITAGSYLASNFPTVTSLDTTVQVLGQLGAYTVGVIHVSRSSHSGQIITLQITLQGESAPTWHLAPLKQLQEELHKETTMYMLLDLGPNELPELEWYGPVMAQQVAYVRVIAPKQSASSRSYIFVRTDDPVVVTVITQAEYLSIAGPGNLEVP